MDTIINNVDLVYSSGYEPERIENATSCLINELSYTDSSIPCAISSYLQCLSSDTIKHFSHVNNTDYNTFSMISADNYTITRIPTHFIDNWFRAFNSINLFNIYVNRYYADKWDIKARFFEDFYFWLVEFCRQSFFIGLSKKEKLQKLGNKLGDFLADKPWFELDNYSIEVIEKLNLLSLEYKRKKTSYLKPSKIILTFND